jgi:ABC-type spermidine/putrescine transport system permease subunit II
VLCWGTLVLLLLGMNAIWTGDSLQVAMFGVATAVVYGTALGLWLAHRQALHRGPPTLREDPEAVPSISLAALALGLANAAMLFGVVFGQFLVFIGAGVWLLAAGRLVVEVRAQRRSLEWERRR